MVNVAMFLWNLSMNRVGVALPTTMATEATSETTSTTVNDASTMRCDTDVDD